MADRDGRSATGRVLVIVPTYNEAESIDDVLLRLRAAVPEAEILVADDASPDGTGMLAERAAAADHRIHVMNRGSKAGLGAAYVAGFRWAAEAGFDVVVEMDADGSHAPEELPRLLTALHGADAVLGSRYVAGGQVVNWPRRRRLLSRLGNAYARGLLRLPLRDATSGFRAYRRGVLDSIDLDTVASQGYCFQVDLAWRAVRKGYRVVEVPIEFTERAQGRSKMSRAIVAEALWRIAWWGVRIRLAHALRLVSRVLRRRG